MKKPRKIDNTYSLPVITSISLIVSLIQISIIVSLICKKTNQTRTHQSPESTEQLCGIQMSTSEAPCCGKIEQNFGFLLNVLMVARLTSDEKENNTVEYSNSNTNGDDSLIVQDAYLDYPSSIKHQEHLHWFPRKITNRNVTHSIGTGFFIPKKGIYYVYVSLTFRYNRTTEISGTVYRKHHNIDGELLSMNKTVQTTGNGNVWSYYDMEMSGLFQLYKGDELYMETNKAVWILPYIVCSYFGILRIPALIVV